jgi:SAM-dependent methyltransferase
MIWLWLFFAVILLFGLVVFRGAPYVPSHRADIAQAFDELYPLSESDVVVDVGSGDGIVLRMASARGAQAVGYELNPALVMISRFLSRHDSRVTVALRDFWLTPLPADTTVVYGFAVSRDMAKMTAKMQREATQLGRPLWYIGYGSELAGYTAQKTCGASRLYEFKPLQQGRA